MISIVTSSSGLVRRGWDITWVFEDAAASEPLKQELIKSGIKIKFENSRKVGVDYVKTGVFFFKR
jgi:hypothetical protein